MHAASPTSADARDVGLLLLRLFAGVSLALAHGVNKLPPSERFVGGVVEMGFPAAPAFAWAAGTAETFGGLLLAIGLLTRPAAFFIVVTMAVAAFLRQAGDPFGERELALLYGAVGVQFLFTGPGRLSLDAVIRKRRAGSAASAALLLVALAGCRSQEGAPAADITHVQEHGLAESYPDELKAGTTVLPGALIARGDSLYHGVIGDANCILCHGPFLNGGSHGTDLRDQRWHHGDGSYDFLVSVTRNGVEDALHSPISRMPPMGGIPLTDEQVRALAAYVYWFSSTRAPGGRSSGGDEHEHSHPDGDGTTAP